MRPRRGPAVLHAGRGRALLVFAFGLQLERRAASLAAPRTTGRA
jgi:DNA-binding GntR family transcriptional regulator